MSHVSCRVFLTLFELASLAVWLQGKTQGRVECARVLWGAYGLTGNPAIRQSRNPVASIAPIASHCSLLPPIASRCLLYSVTIFGVRQQLVKSSLEYCREIENLSRARPLAFWTVYNKKHIVVYSYITSDGCWTVSVRCFIVWAGFLSRDNRIVSW